MGNFSSLETGYALGPLSGAEKGLSAEMQRDALNEGTIFILGEIDTSMILTVLWPLQKMASLQAAKEPEERTPIKIFINSPGGDFFTSFAIADSISGLGQIDIPVYTNIVGDCCSGAAFIAMAGHYRTCNPNTLIMLHSVQSVLAGNIYNIQKEKENVLDRLELQITNHLKINTKLSAKSISEIIKEDTYFDPIKAKRHGLIDDLMPSMGLDTKDIRKRLKPR